jgi:hypothetical protein
MASQISQERRRYDTVWTVVRENSTLWRHRFHRNGGDVTLCGQWYGEIQHYGVTDFTGTEEMRHCMDSGTEKFNTLASQISQKRRRCNTVCTVVQRNSTLWRHRFHRNGGDVALCGQWYREIQHYGDTDIEGTEEMRHCVDSGTGKYNTMDNGVTDFTGTELMRHCVDTGTGRYNTVALPVSR